MGGNVKVGEYQAEPWNLARRDCGNIRSDIIRMLYIVSRHFLVEKNINIFGEAGLHLRYITGSSALFLNSNISNEEFVKYKPTLGDVDIQIDYKYKLIFEDYIKTKPILGPFAVVGHSKHGNEISVLMSDRLDLFRLVRQFDFQFVDNPGSSSEQFLHSASWEDIKEGIKGAHHKILLNAVGLDVYKFSITHGLRYRDDQDNKYMKFIPPITNPVHICRALFGDAAEHDLKHIHSFVGVSYLIYRYIDESKWQQIYDKFISSCDSIKDAESNSRAIMYLSDTLEIF